MYKITDNELTEEILSKIGVKKDEERLIKLLNEHYQYHPRTFTTTNKGNYGLLIKLVDVHRKTE
jgi:hypothetical protein